MGNCSQVCTNTIGSYSCSCIAGYALNANNRTCIGNLIVKYEYKSFLLFSDINECAKNNGNCVQTCTNTFGSFSCSCLTGYVLNGDKITCTGNQLLH